MTRADDDDECWCDEEAPYLGAVHQLVEYAKPIKAPRKRPIGFDLKPLQKEPRHGNRE
jgi:hypothetical protein